MARVVIIGAGIAGLSAAIHAVSDGHHVVVLEKKSKIGGRGTSQNVDGFSLHYGPHLFDKSGPFYKMCRKLSRIKPAIKSMRLDKIEVAGFGPIRPVGNIKQAALNKQAIRAKQLGNPYFESVKFLSSWGVDENEGRIKSVLKSKLSVSNEGWIGLIGRLGAALDEVGVLIETHCEVTAIKGQQVILKDGRQVECDAIILACGIGGTRRILQTVDENMTENNFANVKTTFASSIEVGLSSKPMAGKQCIVDYEKNAAIIDYTAIQPRLGIVGSHLSAIMTGGTDEGRLERLESFLDKQVSGWKKHIVTDLRQSKIVVGYSNCMDYDLFSKHRILLAGPWIKSNYLLSDAAAETGKQAAKGLKLLT
ncbi:MAG TPA: FAD-dependent oxidoreductase [Candidatus Poseidoniaceae archaeon]|nr:MAG TPA: FAD-dependent oxidoreductase [Candidatus Poseidoniales archaeon]DAC58507.1 MAG TPA: FAD-dependent oxidoreductase [Candidatus Poseidoniales archaeon]HII23956.1 FAD-dependent oxidoreductase [Candidatus Poseidoniaceae archaeon]HII50794.1 FAD-dependent oxidoreductase [Candidatus Poseidoniaceae archaeon]